MTALDVLLAFAAFFGLVFGLGCAIAALHPRNRGRAFLVNALLAAASLTLAYVCAWALDERLGW